MANKNNSTARGIHVSPGVYSKETEINYAVKSLGITTLGAVGETLRGPAFQPMLIENWREFQSMFGGTSTEKFSGSQYPKYELPYIAKSYLKESNQLQVCRVLGLSGYNAGPAWAITANHNGKKMIVAVLRSRGHYEKYHKLSETTGSCECPDQTFDTLVYEVGEIKRSSGSCDKPTSYNMQALSIKEYTSLTSEGSSCAKYMLMSGESSFSVNSTNYGRFKIIGVKGQQAENMKLEEMTGNTNYFEYPVSLNPNDKEYILKVFGTDPQNGETPIYVEALYDVALRQLIESDEITEITNELTAYQVYNKADYCGLKPVYDIMYMQEESLSRKDIGKRFLANKAAVENNIYCHKYDYKTNKPIYTETVPGLPESKDINGSSDKYISIKTNEKYDIYVLTEKDNVFSYKKQSESDSPLVRGKVEVGQIYTVVQYTDASGKRHYYYKCYDSVELTETNTVKINTLISDRDKLYYDGKSGEKFKKYSNNNKGTTTSETYISYLVKNNADGNYYRLNGESEGSKDIVPVECDMNDYREAYRYASTPWIVSNIKGDFNKIELNKMFRFHTISDGNTSNNEIKVSIENIRTDEGLFDVLVRDINDTDDFPLILERYLKCSMIPGDSNYIAYKIGSYDGSYETKSKYITVEVNETKSAMHSSPCGFLGYPLSMFDGVEVIDSGKGEIERPVIQYNLNYNEDIKNKRQYFGLSNIVGVDVDSFNYKGRSAYINDPDFLSHGFHLDSRLNLDSYGSENKPKITVDGESGYKFDAVSTQNRTTILDGTPLIGKESEMYGSIYEYVDLRKFTVYFYGGFDGWDVYRSYRSNTDEFKQSKYLGQYNEYSGEGLSFNRIENPEAIGLNQKGINSDWYAYLAAARQFANPESVDINVFCTPGIDLFNNTLLSEEIIDMIEEERADSIYVAVTPDKPFGASDYVDEMYTAEDMVYELEDTEINSNYACTYYPWVKYEDVDNNQYIMLSPTKDVVRNMALCDNTVSPWSAPAGVSRGEVECVKAHYITKLSDEDTLYDGRINPVKTFAQDGVKLWGQKNLQIGESQLNRISVRRLLLRMRKLISIACIGLIFEPNDATTKNKFLSLVTPIMDNIKANRGISDYRIEVNDTVESRMRRELPAKIYFKPINALEYITLDFIVTPENVSFDNI